MFVVDAYTRRIFARLGVWDESVTYDEMQRYFHRHLPADVPLFNEYHASWWLWGAATAPRHSPAAAAAPSPRDCLYGRSGRGEGGEPG